MIINNLNKNINIAIVEYPQLNNFLIYKDKNNLCKNSFLITLYYQMSVVELIGKEKILINYWMNPYMEKLRRLLFVTETDYVDSILNYWN
jgi:hypothetical protein